jgi:hypothetical protein
VKLPFLFHSHYISRHFVVDVIWRLPVWNVNIRLRGTRVQYVFLLHRNSFLLINIIQLLHMNEINMRFYGAEYNNIERGERHFVVDVIWRLPVWNVNIRRYLASCVFRKLCMYKLRQLTQKLYIKSFGLYSVCEWAAGVYILIIS